MAVVETAFMIEVRPRACYLGALAVDHVASDTFGGRVVHVVTVDETASACPSCGALRVLEGSGLYPAA